MKTASLPLVLFLSFVASLSGCSSDEGSDTSTAGGGTTAAAGTTGGGGTATAGTTGGGGAGVAGAGAGNVAGAGTSSVVCDAPTQVFALDGAMGGCNGAACHIPANAATFPPDLISPGVEARVKDVVSASLICTGQKYVDTTNIEASLLLTKLAASPSCGVQMPFGLSPLMQTQIDCIRSWAQSLATQ